VGNVLRRRRGDEIVLVDGEGVVAAAVLCEVSRDRVTARVVSIDRATASTRGSMTLALGVLSSQAMDWAVQKVGEIGCDRFVPVLCQRSQLTHAQARRRLPHWQRVALQTIKQCHRPRCLQVEEPATLEELAHRFLDHGLVGDRYGQTFRKLEEQPPGALLVGPEGGLTSPELDLLAAAGWRRLKLGQFVLRSETAAVVGAAMVLAGLEEQEEGGDGRA